MDDDGELGRLRERVYGADGDGATPEMIARLVELEDEARRMAPSSSGAPVGGTASPASSSPPALRRGQESAAGSADPPSGRRPVPLAAAAADPPTAGVGIPLPSLPTGASADPSSDAQPVHAPETAHPGRRILRWTLTAIGAAALVGIGIAIGSSMAMPAATAEPPVADLPELAFPQTTEDMISADILRDSGIDAASTRYIATIDDFRIYLARPDDGDGRCIVAFTSSDNRPWSAGCASGAQAGAAVFGIDQSLTVAIGQPSGDQVVGEPLRLSDSVMAYVAQ